MTRFHEDRDIDFTQPGEGKEPWRRVHLLTMTVSLLAEPRFVLLGVDQARMEVAQDEEGKALTSAVPVAVKHSRIISASRRYSGRITSIQAIFFCGVPRQRPKGSKCCAAPSPSGWW